MAITVAEVMSEELICVRADSPVSEAARRMAESGVGVVLVVSGEQVVGVCTDRDITVRVTAAGRGPDTTVLQACSEQNVVAVRADTAIADAAVLMAQHAVRRLPVVRDGLLVGIVSVADLACDSDLGLVLGAISSAAPNR